MSLMRPRCPSSITTADRKSRTLLIPRPSLSIRHVLPATIRPTFRRPLRTTRVAPSRPISHARTHANLIDFASPTWTILCLVNCYPGRLPNSCPCQTCLAPTTILLAHHPRQHSPSPRRLHRCARPPSIPHPPTRPLVCPLTLRPTLDDSSTRHWLRVFLVRDLPRRWAVLA